MKSPFSSIGSSRVVRASTAGWLILGAVFVVLMIVGSQRDANPATPQERIEVVARRLACPTCDGESVAESRGAASQAIRQEIARLVAEGQLNDDEIVMTIDDRYAESLRLTPGSTGLESLVWVLPVTVAAVAVAGLAFAFRRWRVFGSVDESSSRAAVPDRHEPSRRWPVARRGAIVLVVIALLGVAAGVLVARNTGERQPGQVMTGGSGDVSVSSLLSQARSLGMGDTENALALYAQVLELEPDNVEALTYFGWLTVLSSTEIDNQDQAVDRLESGLILLRQATIVDSAYPDAHCFLGISFFRFLGDAQTAAPEIETCLASNPPSEVAVLVESLSQQIDEALADGVSTDSTMP